MPSLDSVVEAILFAAGAPISVARIMELSNCRDPTKIESIVAALQQKYDEQHSPFTLVPMGNDWKMTVRSDFLPIVEKIAPETELSKSIIETLAMIAWKAPISQSTVVKTRSTKAYDHIDLLMERGFIDREKSGRSFTLTLTPKFFEYFDIPNRDSITTAVASFEQKPLPLTPKVVQVQESHEQMPLIIPKQVPLRELKAQEHAKQQEFLAQVDKALQDVGVRSSVVKEELETFKKDQTPQ